MTCEVEKLSGRVHIRGEMTIYDAALLKQKLFAALEGEPHVHLDLSAVSEVDTTGVQLLLMAQATSVARAAKFSLLKPSEAISEALGLLRLGALIVSTAQEVSS
jgi:anti-anti-sigma factor